MGCIPMRLLVLVRLEHPVTVMITQKHAAVMS